MAFRKAWAFVFDGHIFYVLGADQNKTLLCDLATGQWHKWHTNGYAFWNMHRGVMWRGQILAVDDTLPRIWQLDPAATDDEGAVPVKPIERAVTGFTPLRGRHSQRVGALRLTASVGAPEGAAVNVQLRFSDDEGVTWVGPISILLREDDFEQELKFRSLGRVREPGRLWEISDAGGLVRIDGLDADMDGE